MDSSLDAETADLILQLADKYDEIKKVTNILSKPVGYKYVVFLTILVDGDLSTFDSHNLADRLEKDILKLDNIYDVIIHVNPM